MDFENIATSAEANLGDFDVNAVMDLLRTRGRLLIKRAYGDWGRYQRYRRAMLENGIDLFQLYSVGIQQKNRADVRLAIDALETVFTRPNIDLYAIVSGDSDFTELIHKLRDHGKYTIGIGLRAATSDLLRRACDEFIFYETLVSEELTISRTSSGCPRRDSLRRAPGVAEAEGRGACLCRALKADHAGIGFSFSEANYGFSSSVLSGGASGPRHDRGSGAAMYVGLNRPVPAATAGGSAPHASGSDLSVKPTAALPQLPARSKPALGRAGDSPASYSRLPDAHPGPS
jgi:uncharacterized protein (TIGR00288 family)